MKHTYWSKCAHCDGESRAHHAGIAAKCLYVPTEFKAIPCYVCGTAVEPSARYGGYIDGRGVGTYCPACDVHRAPT